MQDSENIVSKRLMKKKHFTINKEDFHVKAKPLFYRKTFNDFRTTRKQKHSIGMKKSLCKWQSSFCCEACAAETCKNHYSRTSLSITDSTRQSLSLLIFLFYWKCSLTVRRKSFFLCSRVTNNVAHAFFKIIIKKYSSRYKKIDSHSLHQLLHFLHAFLNLFQLFGSVNR